MDSPHVDMIFNPVSLMLLLFRTSFGATAPPFIDYLKDILGRYPDGGQILKVGMALICQMLVIIDNIACFFFINTQPINSIIP